jgi:hypothetical protein
MVHRDAGRRPGIAILRTSEWGQSATARASLNFGVFPDRALMKRFWIDGMAVRCVLAQAFGRTQYWSAVELMFNDNVE